MTPIGQPGGRGLPPGARGPGPDFLTEAQQALNLTRDQVDRLRSMLDVRAQSDQSTQDIIQAKLQAYQQKMLAGVVQFR